MSAAPAGRILWAMAEDAPHAGQPAGAAREVAEAVGSLARLELELALGRVREAAAALGIGIALLVGAALSVPLVLAFVLATIAAALATAIPVWAALLVVTGLLGLALAGLVAGGLALLRRGRGAR
ncbi:MAG: phage holin family protein [Thermoleophilia bacterium]